MGSWLRHLPTIPRFWAQVQKTETCWLWKGFPTGANKYGDFQVDGVRYRAHRYSYEMAKGPIPDGMKVLHRCDNPICVNPDHLFLGTQGDNMRDMTRKGRHGGKHRKRPDLCRRGHRLDETGHVRPNGTRYCGVCSNLKRKGLI